MNATGAKQAREESPKRPAASLDEPEMLPQRAIDIIRWLFEPMARVLWRIKLRGAEHVPRHGGLIIAANHQTYFDPFWIALRVPRPQRYLAWDEAFSWPMMGPVMRALGAWPLSLETIDPKPLRRALKWLRGDGVLVIFPEGGRCLPDGAMLRFKSGAVRLALQARVPILPVTIRGGHRVWPREYNWPRPAQVEIIYHPLMFVQQQNGEDARACALRETARLEQIIVSAL